MPLPALVQEHLASKGVDISKLKPGVYIPKTVPGITIQHDHAAMVRAVRGSVLAARTAGTSTFFKPRALGAKKELPSFMKKK
jgi:hypothetical protein